MNPKLWQRVNRNLHWGFTQYVDMRKHFTQELCEREGRECFVDQIDAIIEQLDMARDRLIDDLAEYPSQKKTIDGPDLVV
jgi:hypothetical protein